MSLFRRPVRTVRADLGTPVPTHCMRCNSSNAHRRPILILGEYGVKREPWELHTCLDCHHVGKAPTAPNRETL